MNSQIRKETDPDTLFCSPFCDRELNIERLSDASNEIDNSEGIPIKKGKKRPFKQMAEQEESSNVLSELSQSFSSCKAGTKRRNAKKGKFSAEI